MAAADHGPATPAPTVLVIDDEDYVADMIASALEIEGYTAYVSYNGRDGLAQARILRADLVIIDIMLPYINGLVLVEELRTMEHLRDVPIILISAGARPHRHRPGVTFVPKPFDMEAMLGLVARQLGAKGARP